MTSRSKFALLATLYLSQGLPFGFFTQAVPVMMRQSGHELDKIGLTAILHLPWALKFLWAPFVDRRTGGPLGPRRSWIIPLQFAAALNLLLLSRLESFSVQLGLVMLAVLLTNLFAATQDIATDALAVDLLSVSERGMANGIQVAGYRVGMIIGGGAMLIMMESRGWPATSITMALLLLAATIPVLCFTERPHEEATRGGGDGRERAVPGSGELASFMARPGAWSWMAVLVLYKWGDAMASAMVKPLLVDSHLGLSDIGWLSGAAGSTAGLAGALLGGWGCQALGRRRALVTFGALQAVAVLGYVWPALGHREPWVLYATTIFEHVTGGMATVSLFTMMMDVCRPGLAATDYTVQASLVVIATGLAGALSGFSAKALGYAQHFGLCSVLCVVALLLVARVLTTNPLVAASDPVVGIDVKS